MAAFETVVFDARFGVIGTIQNLAKFPSLADRWSAHCVPVSDSVHQNGHGATGPKIGPKMPSQPQLDRY